MNITLFCVSVCAIFIIAVLNVLGAHTRVIEKSRVERGNVRSFYRCLHQSIWVLIMIFSVITFIFDVMIIVKKEELYNDDKSIKVAEIESYIGCSDKVFNEAIDDFANHRFKIPEYSQGHTMMILEILIAPITMAMWTYLFYANHKLVHL